MKMLRGQLKEVVLIQGSSHFAIIKISKSHQNSFDTKLTQRKNSQWASRNDIQEQIKRLDKAQVALRASFQANQSQLCKERQRVKEFSGDEYLESIKKSEILQNLHEFYVNAQNISLQNESKVFEIFLNFWQSPKKGKHKHLNKIKKEIKNALEAYLKASTILKQDFNIMYPQYYIYSPLDSVDVKLELNHPAFEDCSGPEKDLIYQKFKECYFNLLNAKKMNNI
ncbi:hypothetical protein ABPG72_020459 [Tetrahymena utriculariae]